MRMQLSQEQVDYYASLPQEVKEYFVTITKNYHARLEGNTPGMRPITSVEEFDQVIREPQDIPAPEIEPQPDAIQTYLPHLGFGIRYWVSHCLGKDGYYNFDFINAAGDRINTPPGIKLFMDPDFHVRSNVDIQLARMLEDPASYGINPDTKLPPSFEVFVIYCGRPHFLQLNGKEVHRFQTPEIPGRVKLF
ncbi:hypothetical protein VKT23_014963 [Stygiomarasmius scandens]|uniref:Uncharacterized protein n=1 Tax=Marasmiellus scandens TaxID=2682957 RepID=A0ABR1IZ14_9AGAR